MRQLVQHSLVQLDHGIYIAQPSEFANDDCPLLRGKDFRPDRTLLRREQAEPDALHLRSLAPEGHKLFQVAFALRHLAGDRAVDLHLATLNALQNTLVGSRLAARVM